MDQDAFKSLQDAIKFSPDNIPLRLHYAETLLTHKKYTEAEDELKHILTLDPSHIKARFLLARSYYLGQNYSPAIIIMEELTSQQPNSKQFQLLYARALLKEGSMHEAVQAYQEVLKLDPHFVDKELDEQLRLIHPKGSASWEENEELDEDALRLMERPEINFSDIGGMDRIKEEISLKIIKPLEHPDLYKAYGKKVGGGILLYGPPGCGKTHIARATAGEISAEFINVGINDVLDMWIGSSEKNLHEVFEIARDNSPCVLFFDEIDALGASRSDMRQSNSRQLINQFLAEMDGLEADNEGLLIIGATNAPWHLDSAFRRPGRFDRIIFVEPPDKASREAILKILLQDKPTEDIDFVEIAKRAKEYSGADLAAIIDIAVEKKLTESLKHGIPQPIRTQDLKKAMKLHKASTKEWFASARNYALYANDAGLYDDILAYLNIKK